MIAARREAMEQLSEGECSHAGLLLRCLPRDLDATPADLLRRAHPTNQRAHGIYSRAFERWKNSTAEGLDAVFETKSRLIVGLGNDSVLETGITLHSAYGTPAIPGSALRGLCAHFAADVWGAKDPLFLAPSEGKAGGYAYSFLFGSTSNAGFMTFLDAWILPGELTNSGRGLILDVMTPHHPQRSELRLPSDHDDPSPVSFLSVAGAFRTVITCELDDPAERSRWLGLAMKLLTAALQQWGIGGKTNAGYGRMVRRATR